MLTGAQRYHAILGDTDDAASRGQQLQSPIQWRVTFDHGRKSIVLRYLQRMS